MGHRSLCVEMELRRTIPTWTQTGQRVSLLDVTSLWTTSSPAGRQAKLTTEDDKKVIQMCRGIELSAREGREVMLDDRVE